MNSTVLHPLITMELSEMFAPGEEQDEVSSHYHPTPSSVSLADAAKMLKDGTAARTLQ